MTISRNGASRAASVASTSTARDKLKRRDKPYRTEQNKVIAKKRKLDLHTTFQRAPPGYANLPIGTPELAELCKEMSRQQALPVYVVNVRPFLLRMSLGRSAEADFCFRHNLSVKTLSIPKKYVES